MKKKKTVHSDSIQYCAPIEAIQRFFVCDINVPKNEKKIAFSYTICSKYYIGTQHFICKEVLLAYNIEKNKENGP